MKRPAHPGAIVRTSMESEGWTVTEFAQRLGVTRVSASRIVNGRAGISPSMALALERLGWSNANHWLQMQAGYDLALKRARQDREDAA
jgi:addiction module HigA family antidote